MKFPLLLCHIYIYIYIYIYISLEHGGTSTVFCMMEQSDSMGVRAQFSV